MDPEQVKKLREQVELVMEAINVLALAEYTMLLQECGCKHPEIHKLSLMPLAY